MSGLSALPSTALAIAYTDNFLFLAPAFAALTAMNSIMVGAKEWDLRRNGFKLVVLLPDDCGPAYHTNLPLLLAERNLTEVSIKTTSRPFPFFVQTDPNDYPILELSDVPTILSAAWRAIRLYLGKQTVGIGPDEATLQTREIVRFERALLALLGEPKNWALQKKVEIRNL